MNKKIIEKVSQFLQREYYSNLENVSIFQDDDGSYEFFNRYVIAKENEGYLVILKYNSETKKFGSLKNAVSWCIFDIRNKFARAQRVEYLDRIISAIDVNILVHKNLVKKAKDLDTKLIYLAKLSEDQLKRKAYITEMGNYFHESKLLQAQKFSMK
jgi:hypothetical protein